MNTITPTAQRFLWKAYRPAMLLASAAAFFKVLAAPVADPDVFWHIRAGEWMLDHRAIPTVEPFSWTVAGRAWTTHEWLSELVYAAVYRLSGPWGLAVFGTLLLVITLVILARFIDREEGSRSAAVWPALLVTAVGMTPALHLRPQLFSYLFVALTLALLERRRYLWVVPLAAVWANFHGMFILAPALLGLHGIVQGWDQKGLTGWPWRTWLLAVAGALAAPLLTPHGPGLYLYVWETLKDPQMQTYINEWKSPDFHTFGRPFGIALIASVGLTWLLQLRWRTWEMALWAVFAYFALTSSRNIPLFFLAAAPLWTRAAEEIGRRLPGFKTAGVRAVVGLGALILALAAVPQHTQSPLPQGPHPEMPVQAVDYLKAHPDLKRVFNHYNYGGYLIWRSVPVAVDGRADVYVPDVLGDMLSAEKPGQWQSVIAKYRPDAVLWPEKMPLTGYLATQPDLWEKAVQADGAVLYVRRTP